MKVSTNDMPPVREGHETTTSSKVCVIIDSMYIFWSLLIHRSILFLSAGIFKFSNVLGSKHFALKLVLYCPKLGSFTMYVWLLSIKSLPLVQGAESNINNEILRKDNSNNYLHPTSYSRSQFYKKPAIIFMLSGSQRGKCSSIYLQFGLFLTQFRLNLHVSHILSVALNIFISITFITSHWLCFYPKCRPWPDYLAILSYLAFGLLLPPSSHQE